MSSSKYQNEFPLLLDHLLTKSSIRHHTVASHSGVGGNHLSNVIHGRARLSENTARQIAEELNIPAEHQTEFAMLALNWSINRIKKQLGISYFEDKLPIRKR